MKQKIIILILILSIFLSGSYLEENIEENLKIAEESGFLNSISPETLEILEKAGIEELDFKELSSVSFQNIIAIVYESFILKLREPFEAILTISAAAIICSLIHSFCGDFSSSGKVVDAVLTLSAASVIIIPIKNTIEYSSSVITECSEFMLGFIPVYSSAVIASGYVTAATGFRALMLSVVTLISRLSGEIVLPLICIYLALCIAGSVSDFNIEEISKTIKNFAIWILGISLTVFSGIMGLGSLVSASADSAFAKTAKFIINSAVPVVGSTISDALGSIKGCIEITKNTLGVYAVFVIAAIFLPPIISLLSWKICLSVSSGICGFFGTKNLSALLIAASSVIGIMLALVILTAVMFIFSVSIMLMTGGI